LCGRAPDQRRRSRAHGRHLLPAPSRRTDRPTRRWRSASPPRVERRLANEADEHTLWLPIWLGDKADTCLEMVNPTPYTSETIHVIGGIVSVYRNFQNLLDYSERDSLTGLLNRKTFDDQLAKMLAACTDQESVTLPGEPERRSHSDRKSSGWPWSMSTISSTSTTVSATCTATKC
jgi:hypothetical protein